MKYGLTVKEMNVARGMMTSPSLHDWIMLVLRAHYAMRKREVENENY